MTHIHILDTSSLEKAFRIKFTAPKILKHTNNWVSVTLDWVQKKGCEDFWRFKYPVLAYKMYGGDYIKNKKRYINKVSATFEFPDLKDVNNPNTKVNKSFQISFSTLPKEEFLDQTSYDFEKYDQTKYGVVAWFAPRGWEDWNNAKPFTN